MTKDSLCCISFGNWGFAWGGVELHFDIDKGKISTSKICTDSLDPSPLELFGQKLIGKKYQPATIAYYHEKDHLLTSMEITQ